MKADDVAANHHLLLAMAKAYVIGARLQVKRYEEAKIICKENPVLGTYLCIHEVSSLLEDLASLTYFLEPTGRRHPTNQMWRDMRHHIRHDTREEFDKAEARKTARAERLKLDEHLQLSVSFPVNGIKIGGIEVPLSAISDYLDWAENEIDSVMTVAEQAGRLTRS